MPITWSSARKTFAMYVHAFATHVVRCTDLVGVCAGLEQISDNRTVAQACRLIQWRRDGFSILSMSNMGREAAVCALEQHHTAVMPAHFGNAILMQHVPAWGPVRKSKSIHISWKNHLQLRGAAEWACPTQCRLKDGCLFPPALACHAQ